MEKERGTHTPRSRFKNDQHGNRTTQQYRGRKKTNGVASSEKKKELARLVWMLLVIFVVNDGEKQEAEKPARQEDTVLKPHFLLSFAPFRVFFQTAINVLSKEKMEEERERRSN